MASFAHQLELFPEEKIIIQPYKSLQGQNIKDLQEAFKAEGGGAVLLNSALIISIKHILISMNKALSRQQTGAGKGKEVIQLFLTNFIPEKLPKGLTVNFAQTDLSKPSILVAHLPKDKEVNIKDYLKGEEAELDSVGEKADFDLIRKVYAIEQAEVDLDTDLRGSVYNQVALKQLK